MSETAAVAVATEPKAPLPSVGAIAVRDTAVAFPSPQGMAFPVAAPEAGVDGGLDAKRLLHALRRRWLPALALALVTGVAFAVPVWLFLPRGFEAVVWLRIRASGTLLNEGRSAEYDAYRKTQLQLLRSPVVLNAALRKPGISSLKTITEQDDPQNWLARTIEPVLQGDSEVMQLKFRGAVAEDTAKILNAITSCYLDDIVNKDRQDRLSRRDQLEKKFKENQTELRSRRETFNDLARTLGTRDSQEVATQRGLLMDQLGTARGRMIQAENDLERLEAEIAIIEFRKDEVADARADKHGDEAEGGDDGADQLASEELIEAALSREPEIRALESQIAGLTDSILGQAERSARGMNEPAVRRMVGRRQQLLRQIEVAKSKLRPQILGVMGSGGSLTSAGSVSSPRELELRRQTLVRAIEKGRLSYDDISKQVIDLGNANADLENRKSEIDQLARVTDQIGLQLEATSLDLTAPPRVTLLEEAVVPGGNDTVKRLLLALMAACAGGSCGGALIVGLEYMRNRLGDVGEIPSRIGVRAIGTIPWIGKTRRGGANEYRLAESVDSIRTLLLQGNRETARVIMVTSAGEREAKSSLAANLAASIARSGHRTLLIEGSLRNPSVHAALQIDAATPGMAELLRGETTNNEVVQPTAIDGLFAVTAGAVDYDAITALSRQEFPRIIQVFRDSFDHVIIDAGPVLAYADTLIMGRQSDIAILSTMRDVSSVPATVAALDRLRSAGVRVAGCVLSGVSDSGTGSAKRFPA
jgi:capsular exopolysaccharide synthesis family protein